MKVKVNGKEQEFDNPHISLLEILQKNNIMKPELISMQLNGSYIKRDDYQKIFIKENDELDFLFFMGGGSHFIRIAVIWN